jgi:hypothetical protein
MMTAVNMLLFGNNQCTADSTAKSQDADRRASARPNSLLFKMLRCFPGSFAGLALPLLPYYERLTSALVPAVGRFKKSSYITGQ